jgi:hypothetical protein
MPKGDFYAGLPLAEQLQKFVDHHHDHRVRHISKDEAELVDRAIDLLRRGYPKAIRRREYDDLWRQLEHHYETAFRSAESELELVAASFPRRSQPLPETPEDLLSPEWLLAEGEASARSAQIALNVVFRAAYERDLDIAGLFAKASKRRSPPVEAALSDADNALVNRALYQPTIAVEQSPPVFESLATIVASGDSNWVTVVQEVGGNPVVVLCGGGVIVALLVIQKIASGAADGLSQGLRERLYQWSKPKGPSDSDRS